MRKILLCHLCILLSFISYAQPDVLQQNAALIPDKFTIEKVNASTPVKNQAITGTCWCFSTTSLVESQCLKNNLGQIDISEMFTVRNIYIEKAKNYILRQGHTQFGEGGLGHDLIRAIATYGAVPENIYSGLKGNQKMHNHIKLVQDLQHFLDSVLKLRPLPQNWMDAYVNILDLALGKPPVDFNYLGKRYTPKTFATDVLKFDAGEYVNITSFMHHPYYAPFIIEVPDNFSNGAYYNLPLNEMILLTKDAINTGYSVLWDADVSNSGFMQKLGIASHYDSSMNSLKKNTLRSIKQELLKNERMVTNGDRSKNGDLRPNRDSIRKLNDDKMVATEKAVEANWDAEIRQALYENLTTQDDHLMHITGIEKSETGKTYFLVKNSWGDIGPNHGFINVSEAYFAINTISLVIPKAALSKELQVKLGIK